MIRGLSIFLLVCCGSGSFASEVYVKARVADGEPIRVGQRVQLEIDALGAEGWVGISRIHIGEIEGALILDRNPSGVTINETVNGQSRSGQRKVISIFPQRAGNIVVPEFSIQVGLSSTDTVTAKQIASLSFTATLPSDVNPGMPLISTPSLTVSQRWSKDADDWAVGDAVERTIRIEADDLPGMLLQPVEITEKRGLGIYPKQPLIEDRMNRGQLRGIREDSITMVFEHPGTYVIPDVTMQWFDLKNQTLKNETLPGRTYIVIATEAVPSTSMPWPRILILSTIVTILIALIFFVRPVVRLAVQTLRASEWIAFQRVRREARTSPKALLNALLKWGDQLEEGFRLDTFLKTYGDPGAPDVLEPFYPAVWTARSGHQHELFKTMARARSAYFKQLKKQTREHKHLPPLNP